MTLGSSTDLTSAILGIVTPGLKADTLAITGDSTSDTLGTVSLVGGQLTYTAGGSGFQDIPQNGTLADSFALRYRTSMATRRPEQSASL